MSNRLTIEPATERWVQDKVFNMYEHSVYGSESILEGHSKRVFKDSSEDVHSLIAKYPTAEVLNYSTKETHNPLPVNPPSWFDPMDAGECWHEDDY